MGSNKKHWCRNYSNTSIALGKAVYCMAIVNWHFTAETWPHG